MNEYDYSLPGMIAFVVGSYLVILYNSTVPSLTAPSAWKIMCHHGRHGSQPGSPMMPNGIVAGPRQEKMKSKIGISDGSSPH